MALPVAVRVVERQQAEEASEIRLVLVLDASHSAETHGPGPNPGATRLHQHAPRLQWYVSSPVSSPS